jgi:large subunit ribosomal protein L29
MNKKLEALRKLSSVELSKKVVELKKELFDFRFQAAVGNLQKTSEIGRVKRGIAQLKTIISEREEEENK